MLKSKNTGYDILCPGSIASESIDNIWSVLFTTGYLTQVGMTEQGAYKLIIPNKEVREVYKLQIQDWFDEKLRDNTKQLTAFWNSIEERQRQ